MARQHPGEESDKTNVFEVENKCLRHTTHTWHRPLNSRDVFAAKHVNRLCHRPRRALCLRGSLRVCVDPILQNTQFFLGHEDPAGWGG